MNWVINFASTYSGGGLVRLVETIEWFAENGGANFIVNERLLAISAHWPKQNSYAFVRSSVYSRLLTDTPYINTVIGKFGDPDVYFSYGIPIPKKIGKLNWFHLSNALTVSTDGYELPLLTRVKQKVLRIRLIRSIRYTQFVTCESHFSVQLFESVVKRETQFPIEVLENGYSSGKLREVWENTRRASSMYAVTVGTYKYKKLETVLAVYKQLKRSGVKLRELVVIGRADEIPIIVREFPEVSIRSQLLDEEYWSLLYNAEYYISASQIENGSLASLEALMLSKASLISRIPAHEELVASLEHTIFVEEESVREFIYSRNSVSQVQSQHLDWTGVCKKMFDMGVGQINSL